MAVLVRRRGVIAVLAVPAVRRALPREERGDLARARVGELQVGRPLVEVRRVVVILPRQSRLRCVREIASATAPRCSGVSRACKRWSAASSAGRAPFMASAEASICGWSAPLSSFPPSTCAATASMISRARCSHGEVARVGGRRELLDLGALIVAERHGR